MGCHDRRCRRQSQRARAPVTAVCFSPDGSKIATASGSDASSLWEATTGARSASGPGTMHAVLAVSFHPDGTRLAMAGRRRRRCGFGRPQSGAILGETLRHEAAVAALAFSPDGRSS